MNPLHSVRGILTAVKTGKTHRSPTKKSVGSPIWDINTKAATGL